MAETKLELIAKKLIANKFVTSITGSISDRAKRRYEKLGIEVVERLKKRDKLPKNSNLELNLEWSDEVVSWARNYSLALEEFKQVNPEAYNQFQEILKKHRTSRRIYLDFKGSLDEEDYINVIQDVIKGISYEKAKKFYDSLNEIGLILKKRKEEKQRFLLPE